MVKIKDIKPLFLEENFLDVSFTTLKNPISHKIYKAQVLSDNIGGMTFLKEHLSQKLFKNSTFKTALVALYPYYDPKVETDEQGLKVSLYAKNRDYHLVLTEKLERIILKLKKMHPKAQFLSAVDSKPVLEKDLAYKAGLGWIGKNTCLLNKTHGSLFFIAEILTDLSDNEIQDDQKKNKTKTSFDFENLQLKTDHCGTCTKCIKACPTGALTPRKLEVEKCISYRNIESKDYSPNVLTNSSIHSWFFGCDICQTVCPWNAKVFGKEKMKKLYDFRVLNKKTQKELEEILTLSNNELMKKYKDSPLSRARGNGLKRNAMQIIHENKILEMKPVLQKTALSLKLEPLRKKVLESLQEDSKI